ncbi:MAG: hypothetical protein ACTHLW_16745 [Verrucomicrobiota bacterium]
MKAMSLLLLLILAGGCAGLPNLDKVQYSFSREHPETTVLEVDGQLTNRFRAQFHIYYLKPGDTLEHEDVWHYHHAAEAWVAGRRESVR